ASALERAAALARATAKYALIDSRTLPRPAPRGEYASPSVASPMRSRREWYELLMRESRAAPTDPRIVDWEASVAVTNATHRLITSEGGDIVQRYRFLFPHMTVTAHADGDTQTRTLFGDRGICQQGGEEILERFGFAGSMRRLADEALELVAAPNCPSGTMDVLLLPDQMILQIHESIGHPLELDRILGDERNFAGTSFVTPDMFGHYRYGSDLLNVSFDPGRAHEFAGFAFDDDGMPAQRQMLIERGVLKRALGGALSMARSRAAGTAVEGVATTRACSWNRAPIDRMSNLNVEPGESSFEDIIASTELGILMQTNCSWSIDDSRNKFQFGCEYARLIRNGQLAEVVRTPNYRGVSATFWRSLAMVGNESTFEVMGTPFCGKGEPSQIARVGHAAPVCKFASVDVFGGAA
ncbi:MAG TPA: TldD/PmbA family protein, partial [Burkholderiaceae bacterium]|nr:TldD/PmbA family protein [Burkholderiaceae bacterium]